MGRANCENGGVLMPCQKYKKSKFSNSINKLVGGKNLTYIMHHTRVLHICSLIHKQNDSYFSSLINNWKESVWWNLHWMNCFDSARAATTCKSTYCMTRLLNCKFNVYASLLQQPIRLHLLLAVPPKKQKIYSLFYLYTSQPFLHAHVHLRFYSLSTQLMENILRT